MRSLIITCDNISLQTHCRANPKFDFHREASNRGRRPLLTSIHRAVVLSLPGSGLPSGGGEQGMRRAAPPYRSRGRHHEVHEVEPSVRRLLLVAGAPPPVKPRRHPPCIFVAGKHTSELPSLHTLSSMLLFFLNGMLGNCGLLHHET
jgi:hypothetical protein